MNHIFKDKVFLITGGTGSLGKELTKELLKFSPRSIRIVDINEYELHSMSMVMKDECLRYMYGDVKDRDRMLMLMRGVNLIIHCAALKHVPLCEYNPTEAIKTNVLGSLNIVDCAIERGVERVLGISSDKAVHPISSYGATKQMMERLFIEATTYTQTKFSCVRLGNLWGSSGSVIETWMKQRIKGEPLTITEKDMTRFWMHIDEAVGFIISKLIDMEGGEIFIPLMPSYTLHELVTQIAPECEIKVIGRRRGEKKNELLYSEDESKYIERKEDCLIIRNH